MALPIERLKEDLRQACANSRRGWSTLQLLRKSLDTIENLEKKNQELILIIIDILKDKNCSSDIKDKLIKQLEKQNV